MNFLREKFELILSKTETYKPSLRNQFENVQKIYSVVGLRFLPVQFSLLRIIMGYLFVGLALLVPFFTLYFFCFKDVDIVSRVPAIVGFLVALQSLFKSLHMIIFGEKFLSLVMEVIEDSESHERKRDSTEFVIGTKNHTFVNRFLLLLHASYVFACFQLCFFPIMTRQPFMLPVSYEIPGFDHRYHPGYEINYGYIVMQAFHACFVLMSK